MRDSRVLPDLRMLPASSLVTHEDSDPRRVDKLKERLRKEGRLKSPPIVAAIPGTDRYVVLDGANRTNALAKIGAPHVVAQVVSYGDPGVELDTWYHVVAGMDLAEFEDALTKITELK
ncbi:MAG: ParB N-terminal domain-containing protein, partial [Anaerolineales bacterium]|nr:ParB N-terminal domain-containing protein [Anaerolineales bacterium]